MRPQQVDEPSLTHEKRGSQTCCHVGAKAGVFLEGAGKNVAISICMDFTWPSPRPRCAVQEQTSHIARGAVARREGEACLIPPDVGKDPSAAMAGRSPGLHDSSASVAGVSEATPGKPMRALRRPAEWGSSGSSRGRRRRNRCAASYFPLFSRQLICPTGGVREFLSSPLRKIFFFCFSELCFTLAIPPRHKGRYRDRHEREVGCGGRNGA